MKALNAVPARLAELGIADKNGKVTLPYALRSSDVETSLKDVPGREDPKVSRLAELLAMAKSQQLGGTDDEQDFEDRLITLTASDETVDRYGDVILVDGEFKGKKMGKGWQLQNWVKNPVIMPFHEHHVIPVANAIDTWREKKDGRKRLRMTILSVTKDVEPLGAKLLAAVKARVLRTFSVGFLPVRGRIYEPTSDAERKDWGLGPHGLLFAEQELLENSFVSIPANPNACEGREVAGLLRLADDVSDVDEEMARELRDTVYRSAGFVQLEGVTEGPALDGEPESGDTPLDAAGATALEQVVGQLKAVTTKLDKVVDVMQTLASRDAERAGGEGASGSRRDGGDPDDSALYEPLLRGWERVTDDFGAATK